jgi:hypothetical protein
MSLSIFIFSCQMDEHMMISEENSSNSDDELLFLKSYSGNKLGNWNLLFEETFEGPNPFYAYVSTQFSEKHSFKVSSSPSFKGKNAGRFELRKSDSKSTRTGKRAEILLGHPSDKENWYSFAIYLPSSGFERDNDDEVLTQWHTSGGTPTLSLRAVKDRLVFRIGHDAKIRTALWDFYDFGTIPKNEWINFVFHIVHSDKSDGFVEIWRNGNKVVTHKGPNTYKNQKSPRWKVGIYKASWEKKSTDVDKRVLYYDNIRMGNEKASFSEMDPSKDNNKGWGPYVPEIKSFTLINSIGNKVLGTVPNNATINIGPLNDNRITLRANLEDGFDGSMELELKGPKSFTVTRNEAAYTLYGYSKGNYHNGGGTPKGTYTLKATPYEGHNKSGKMGTPVELNFKIVDEKGSKIIDGVVDKALDGDLIKIEEPSNNSFKEATPEKTDDNKIDNKVVSGNGLVGYWKMDERNSKTIKDHSGTGNHAEILRDSDVSWVSGIKGYALKTNGNFERYSSVRHNSSVNLSEAVTIAAWIQPSKKDRKHILSKGDGYELMIFENGKVEFRVNRDTNASDYRITSRKDYPTNGSTWMHVAVTFDGRKSTLYINGEEDVSETYNTTKINTNNSPVLIGAKKGFNRWTGALDEVRLYNRALSSSEIRDIYK